MISKKNEKTGIVTRTHQQAYISDKVEDLVISREAMESLRFVSDLDDRKRALVRVVSSTVMNPRYSTNSSPIQSSPVEGNSLNPGAGREEDPARSLSLRARVRVYNRERAAPVSVPGTRQSECTLYTTSDEGTSSWWGAG